MAFQYQININPTGGSPRIAFNPNPLPANALDQIFWTNNDSVAHWPGLLNGDGTVNQTFFIPNQIAPNGDTSAIFCPAVAPATFRYVCSLHPDEKGVVGVINVT